MPQQFIHGFQIHSGWGDLLKISARLRRVKRVERKNWGFYFLASACPPAGWLVSY